MSQHLELDQLMHTAVRMVGRILDVPNTFVMTVDEERKSLSVIAASVPFDDVRDLRFPLDEHSAAALSVLAQRPVTIDDVAGDPRITTPLAARFTHKALLAVPMLSDGRPVGAMILGDP